MEIQSTSAYLEALFGPRKPVTKLDRLKEQLSTLEKKQHGRITRGRLQGGSAGALNRDVAAITHRINLKQAEIKQLAETN